MKFKKIQLSKSNTLNVVYSNEDGDTITMVGANIVHKDLKEAMRSLVPHLAVLTEQRETISLTLEELEEQRGWEEKGIFTRMAVSGVIIVDDEVQLFGSRILNRGDVIQVNAPKVNTVDDERYEYLSELSLAVDNLKYEAEQYVRERKWGLKEGTLDFEEAGDPFNDMELDEVPKVTIETGVKKDKKPRKKKKEAVA